MHELGEEIERLLIETALESQEYIIKEPEDAKEILKNTIIETFIDAYNAAAKGARTLTEAYNDGWIPVTEKLPEDPIAPEEDAIEYIVMIKGAAKPTTLNYVGHGEWWDGLTQSSYKVTAWQPLPQPYIGEEKQRIKCNSPYGYCGKCIIDMDAQESLGGKIVCNTAEDLDFTRQDILKHCEYAEGIKDNNE